MFGVREEDNIGPAEAHREAGQDEAAEWRGEGRDFEDLWDVRSGAADDTRSI